MSSRPVYADAHSRLHADIAMVRLVRAGLPASRLSAVFPSRLAPNSVCCWLSNFHRIPHTSGIPLAAAGLLGAAFRHGIDAARTTPESEDLGLTSDVTSRLLERAEEGRIIVCVHARTESEAAVAWHILHHVGLESISFPSDELVFTPREMPTRLHSLADLAA